MFWEWHDPFTIKLHYVTWVYTLLLYIGELVLTMKIHDNTTQETQKYRNLTIVIIKHILEILIDW